MWKEALRHGIEGVVLGMEALAALAIAVGAAAGLWALARQRDMAAARRRISHALLLALDFTIGADLLKVALVPDLKTVAIVGAAVAVRIALTLTLVWELGREARRKPGAT